MCACMCGGWGALAGRLWGLPPLGCRTTPHHHMPRMHARRRFFSRARLVLIALRQQLEEVCVGAVRELDTRLAEGAALRGGSPGVGLGPGGGLPPGMAQEVVQLVSRRPRVC